MPSACARAVLDRGPDGSVRIAPNDELRAAGRSSDREYISHAVAVRSNIRNRAGSLVQYVAHRHAIG
jgi:hypothetical protein